MGRLRWAAPILFALIARADITCPCDPSKPDTERERQCSLCSLAAKEPAGALVFFVQDSNPRKEHRWLALPHDYSPGTFQKLSDLSSTVRLALWKGAIEKAKSMFGDQWGVAYNGDHVRTQCLVHLHIGKLIEGVEFGDFSVVGSPEEIPMPPEGVGMWVHEVDGKLHVHMGEQVTENVLER